MSQGTRAPIWHAAALRLRAEGLSAAKVYEALAGNPESPSESAVKKFLQRSKKDPGKALQTVARSAPATPPPIELDKDQSKILAAMVMETQERMFHVLGDSLNAIAELYAVQHEDLKDRPDWVKFVQQRATFALASLVPLASLASGTAGAPGAPGGGKDALGAAERALDRLKEITEAMGAPT